MLRNPTSEDVNNDPEPTDAGSQYAEDIIKGAVIGGVIGAGHAAASIALSVIGALAFIAGGESMAAPLRLIAANYAIDTFVTDLVTKIGVPALVNDPLLDVISKCAIGGAVVGAGVAACGVFARRVNQADAVPQASHNASFKNARP